MKPIQNIAEALQLIDQFSGSPADFSLAVPDSLNDAVGLNMALITDKILARGWEPSGVEQRTGYRLYRYKIME